MSGPLLMPGLLRGIILDVQRVFSFAVTQFESIV